MNIGEMKGRPVITIDEGERMGQVSDAVLDLAARRLVSLLVSTGGLIGGSRHTLDVGAIHRIGPDAIMVQRRSELRDGEDVPEGLVRLSELRGRAIVTEAGQELGHVAGILIDDLYAITDVDMASGSGPLGIFASTTAVPVGDVLAFGDVVTVRDAPPGGTGGDRGT